MLSLLSPTIFFFYLTHAVFICSTFKHLRQFLLTAPACVVTPSKHYIESDLCPSRFYKRMKKKSIVLRQLLISQNRFSFDSLCLESLHSALTHVHVQKHWRSPHTVTSQQRWKKSLHKLKCCCFFFFFLVIINFERRYFREGIVDTISEYRYNCVWGDMVALLI